MVVKTGPVLSDVPRQVSGTRSDPVNLMEQVNHILHCPGAGKGAEILVFILFHCPGKQDSGKSLGDRHFNVRIRLVVLEHGIVFRPVLLDQIAFQHKSLQLRVRQDVLKSGDPGNHLFNLRRLVPAALEILAHPVFQADGLSHIDYLILVVVHNVNPRLGRELLQFLFYIKHWADSPPSAVLTLFSSCLPCPRFAASPGLS